MAVTQGDTSFYIASEHLECVLVNLMKFSEKYHYEHEKHIEDMQTFAATSYMMCQFGWNFIYDKTYNIIDIKMTFLEPNTSHVVFKEIAAYVAEGSYITMMNNGRLYCGWNFNGKKCKRMVKPRDRRNENIWANMQAPPMIMGIDMGAMAQPQVFIDVNNDAFIDFDQLNVMDAPAQAFEGNIPPNVGAHVNALAEPEDFIVEPRAQELREIVNAVFDDDLPF